MPKSALIGDIALPGSDDASVLLNNVNVVVNTTKTFFH
jgi:hypothetical protein